MNKKSFITALLALVALAGQAKTYKTIKAPETIACVNVHQGEFKAREVILTDTATTVHFTMEKEKGQSFRFAKDRYLVYTKDYFKEGAMKYLPAYLAYFL